MRILSTLFVGLAAAIGASARVAAGPLLPAQRLDSHAALPAAEETAAVSFARVAVVGRAGAEPATVVESNAPRFQEPFYPTPPSAARDPVPWRPPPLRRGIASPGIVDAMIQLVAPDSIDASVIALEGYHTRKADLESTWLVAEDLAARFRSFGADSVFVHAWTPGYAPNVIAIRRGATRPGEVYLIGGHYDSISHVGSAAPGADDNASGTAAVLECARVLCQYRFESTLQFAAWSAEEFGLVGSGAYVSHIMTTGDNLLGAINIDMIGYLEPGDLRDLDIISNPWSDWLRDTVMQVAKVHVPELQVVPGQYPGSARSDQASFWSYGFSAISFFEDSESPSPYIHTGGDTYLGSYNDPVLAWRSTQVAVATLATLATPIVVPLLVQDLVGRAVEGQVELTWVLGATAGEIASVEVERALEAEGPWSVRTPAPLAPEPRMRFVDTWDRDQPVWYRLALHVQGGVLYAGPLAVEPNAASGRTTLAARQPGPGQPVEIRYTIGLPAADLRLGVFDVRGRRVRLLEAGARTAGSGLRYWDRRDDSGAGVTRGVYFVLLDAGAARVTRKLVLVHE